MNRLDGGVITAKETEGPKTVRELQLCGPGSPRRNGGRTSVTPAKCRMSSWRASSLAE